MEERVVLHELCCDALKRFGQNPHGKPIYRVVRADSRQQWFAGEFGPKYPKYKGCWVMEKWCPAEQYGSEKEWDEAIREDGRSSLGPFPRQGDYEMSYPFLDDKQAYMPGPQLAEFCAAMVEKGAAQTRSTRWAQIQQEKENAHERRMKVLRDMIADAAPLRGGDVVRKYAEDMVGKPPVVRPTMPLGASMQTENS